MRRSYQITAKLKTQIVLKIQISLRMVQARPLMGLIPRQNKNWYLKMQCKPIWIKSSQEFYSQILLTELISLVAIALGLDNIDKIHITIMFLHFGRCDIIPISIWIRLKKASEKLPRLPAMNVCKNEFSKSIKLYILEIISICAIWRVMEMHSDML